MSSKAKHSFGSLMPGLSQASAVGTLVPSHPSSVEKHLLLRTVSMQRSLLAWVSLAL